MDKKTVLALAAIVFCLGLFFMKKKFHTDTFRASRSPDVPVQQTVRQEIVDVKSAQQSQETIAQERRAYSAQILTGLKQISTKKSGSTLKFRFRPKSEPVFCLVGDFDFIKGSVDSLTADVLLLTIEPLSGDKGKAVSYRLSMKDIAEGKTFNVQLPREDKARDYGVYLCMDYQKTSSCSNKKILGSKEWNSAIRSEKDIDRVIYFQMLSVTNNNVWLIPSKNWDSKSLEKLKLNLAPFIQSPESIDLLRRNMQQLQSVPARVSKDTLELLLPHKAPNC